MTTSKDNNNVGATVEETVCPPSSSSERFDFPTEEVRILSYWDDIKAFETSLELSKDRPRYTFLDGPPFATGLPHYGHLLAGTIKDTVLRYAAQNGYHVERRFGWDCHGLPVEYEIDKQLDIKSKADVMKMGIAEYNAKCRAIVMRYSSEWEATVRRSARWIDFKNDYKTMYPSFMETVWWAVRQLFDKGQVYRGFRVMPYSTACNTPLSNFEVALNYKDVQDISLTVEMPLVNDPNTVLLVWTTTPWTLPSNLAICAHPDLSYAFARSAKNGKVYIIAESLLADVMKAGGHTEYKVEKTVKGTELEGLSYTPLFTFFADRQTQYPKTFTVVTDTYVTADTGTGLVHQAPAFGEDDYNVCLRYQITGESDVPCPIDDAGRFTTQVSTYEGQYWKDANNLITKEIDGSLGRLFHRSQITHSYPFCWRSDTPLIYRAIPCWFVRVQNIIPELLAASAESRWVPDFVQEKRFHNWLAGARDWAISRNRYWGTPIPIWANEDFTQVKCIGSVEELERLSGVTGIKDLHRENIDHITIEGENGATLRRVEEVLDCWFESGCVPYATEHYPFENKEHFEANFPADFIGEGLDQTRGWFYTLTVLGVHLFGKVPFKNLIVNGLVLAADGKKMSKRLKNYPEPSIIFDSYGADALRLYLINSPVVRAEPLKFREEGVRNIIRDVMLPWLNAYRFLTCQMEAYTAETGETFRFQPSKTVHPRDNVMDAWILASLQTLIETVRAEMADYKLYAVVPPLLKFIEALTNWYIRFNRRRLRGDAGVEEQRVSLNVLFDVVYNFCIIMAPFTPIFAENLYLRLRPNIDQSSSEIVNDQSVHFLMFPQVRKDYFDEKMERAFSGLQEVVERVRTLREARNIPLKTPLKQLTVLSTDEIFKSDLATLSTYVEEELNIRKLSIVSDEAEWGVQYKATPNFKALGQRLKADLPKVQKALNNVSQGELKTLLDTGKILVAGHELGLDDVAVVRMVNTSNDSLAVACETRFIILLDITVDASLKEEGLARELVNRVQRLRKKAGLKPTDDAKVCCSVTEDPENELRSTLEHQMDYLSKTLKSTLKLTNDDESSVEIADELFDIGSGKIKLVLFKP